jgi:Trehalose-phosphatase
VLNVLLCVRLDMYGQLCYIAIDFNIAALIMQARHPCILSAFDQFLSLASGKRVVVFLDYDGTLTPIVSNPDMAFMSDSMRSTVKRVGQTFPTAIISGRGRRKVENFVQLNELFYAGSHGLDIKGPVVRSDPTRASLCVSGIAVWKDGCASRNSALRLPQPMFLASLQ